MSLDATAQVGRAIRDPKHFCRKPNGTRFVIHAGLDLDGFAAEKKFAAQQPAAIDFGPCGEFLQLSFEPRAIPLNNTPAFIDAAATRYGDPRRPVRPQTKHISPRAGIFDHEHWHLLRSDGQRFPTGNFFFCAE